MSEHGVALRERALNGKIGCRGRSIMPSRWLELAVAAPEIALKRERGVLRYGSER